MANERQYEPQGGEVAEQDIETTARQIREAVETIERWLKEYSRQNQAFESFLVQNGLQTEFEAFKKNWVPESRMPLSSLTADPASICLVDGMITISYLDVGDFNHFYSMLVDLEAGDISAVYSPGGTPGSRYISLNEEEKWIVLMEIGHVMAADEQMIERPPLLIQRTRSLVFAERYRELIAAVKGEAFADAAAFRMFYEGLSGDGSKAAEAISEIESEIRRMQRDADGGKEVLEEAIGKVAAWAADAGIYDELQPIIERLRTDAGANAHRLQTKAEGLREEVHDWLQREARAENAGHLENDAGNREENISARTGHKTGTPSR